MAKDTHLTVLEGGNTVAPGTTTWAEEVRNDARTLAGKLDEGYMDLARLLWTIYDTPINGDPKNGPIYTQWGYVSFADYVEQELGIHRKKAQRLRSVWYNLEVRLGDALPEEVRARIVALGFSKVRELVGVLTARNALKWTDKAEELSYPKLCTAIRKYREEIEKYQAEKAVAAGGGEEVDHAVTEGYNAITGEAGPAPVDSIIGQPMTNEPDVPDMKPEDEIRKSYQFTAEQYVIVKDALDSAAKLSGSSKNSNNLHLICLEFLANTGDGKGSTKGKMKKLVSIAQVLGLELVIVDDGDVVFGLETLENLAKESK